MCLIVTQSRMDKPIDLTMEEISDAFDHNSDGAGIMFDRKGELIIEKPFNTVFELWDAYVAALDEYTNHLCVHWRMATSGSNSALNTHPHVLCRGKVGMMHNGILPSETTVFDISDTVYWARTVFYGRSVAHVMGKRFRNHIEQYIGGDRIALLDENGNLSLLNEAEGNWQDGRWHSNNCLWYCSGYSFNNRGARLVRYQYPYTPLSTSDFLTIHFDNDGYLKDKFGNTISDDTGDPRMASDLVEMSASDTDDDIHDYHGLLTWNEMNDINVITKEWENAY